MAPTLHNGERLLVRRTGRQPRTRIQLNDIVVFRVSGADYPGLWGNPGPDLRIKRVAATAGDPVPEWLPAIHHRDLERFVPKDVVLVRGDAPGSEGSEQLGYINLSRVEGIVVRPKWRAIKCD